MPCMHVCVLYSHLKHLQSCVRSVVHAACKKVAAGLSDVLVRASVQLSPTCSNSDVSGQVTATAIASATYPVRFGLLHFTSVSA